MNLKDYLNLNEEDRKQLQVLIDTHLLLEVPDTVSRSVIEIDTYYEERKREREQMSTITWPEKLSKKESVVCRLKMMMAMLHAATCPDDDCEAMKKLSLIFIKSAINDVFTHKSSATGPKWPGLNADGTVLLNCIYNRVLKSYEKKFKV